MHIYAWLLPNPVWSLSVVGRPNPLALLVPNPPAPFHTPLGSRGPRCDGKGERDGKGSGLGDGHRPNNTRGTSNTRRRWKRPLLAARVVLSRVVALAVAGVVVGEVGAFGGCVAL